jgi:hypothetical protein
LLNQSDYVLRLIEQIGGVVRQSMEKLHVVDGEKPHDIAGQAIGLALGMDPALASRLSPRSLVSLLKLGSLDDRVIELVAQAIELEAGALQTGDKAIAAQVRREQASAVRSLLGPTHAD